MTAAIGRLVLVEPEPRGAADDGACPWGLWGTLPSGVLYGRGVLTFTLSPDSVISTRSSSSLLAKPLDFLGGSIFVCSSHLPSGWMVTWSTDLDVFFRISFT